MTNWLQHIKNKLRQESKTAQEQHLPLVHEPLTRNEREKDAYEQWKTGRQKQQMLDFISNQFYLSQREKGDGGMFRVLQTTSSNGFMLRYPTGIEATEFQHLFDYLRDQIRSLGYVVYTSDRRVFDHPKYVETIQRHYLKPSLRHKINGQDEKLTQLYGNIHLELHMVDERPTHIKCLCHNYVDHKFEQADDFSELVERICKPQD
jgi:hypothetical protein